MRLSRTCSLILSLVLLLTVTAAGVYAAGAGSVTTKAVDLTLLSRGEYCNVYFDPDFEEKLTENESKLYAILSENLPLGEETVDIGECGYTDLSVLTEFLQKVLNTELAAVPVSDQVTAVITDGVITRLNFTYPDSGRAYVSTVITTVDEGIAHALACVEEDMTDVEKALVLHDYLVREVDYDLRVVNGFSPSYGDPVYGLEGVFLNRTAVCQGYALAYSRLLKEAGIPSVLVASDLMNHAWNMVKIDDNWFHVDCTWDDPTNSSEVDFCRGGFVNHSNFLRSDIEMEEICEHYEWYLLTGEDTPPEATSEDSFAGWCFRPKAADNNGYTDVGCISYADGYYYALSTHFGSNVLRKSKIDGTDLTLINLARTYDYMFYYNGSLYANDASYVYELNLAGEEQRIVAAAEGTIANFWLKLDTLAYYEVLADGTAVRREVDLNASASNIVNQDGFIFILGDDTAALAGYSGTAANLTVPGKVEGRTVTSVKSDAFYENRSITSIVLPDTITAIGDYAFYKAFSLKSVTLPESLEKIGSYAFYNIWDITEITIPASVTEIGKQAFSYCWNLTDVTFEGPVPENWSKDIFLTDFSQGYELPTLHFTYGQEGWTYPTWTDRYGTVYNTETDIPLLTVSGKITSYGDADEPVTVRLLNPGTNEEVVSVSTVTGTYTLTAPAGTYNLEVSKKNHVTRTYTVVLEEASR